MFLRLSLLTVSTVLSHLFQFYYLYVCCIFHLRSNTFREIESLRVSRGRRWNCRFVGYLIQMHPLYKCGCTGRYPLSIEEVAPRYVQWNKLTVAWPFINDTTRVRILID